MAPGAARGKEPSASAAVTPGIPVATTHREV
jgi:hypothetical protein